MIETIIMYILTGSAWVFIVAPAILGICFDYNPKSYKDALKAGLVFTALIIVMVLVAAVIALIFLWLSGEPAPISTMIEKLL